MSFDPQNPRGAPRPTAAPAPSYIPPQPVERRPPVMLLAALALIALAVLVVGVFLIMNSGGSSPTPSPTPYPHAVIPGFTPNATASVGATATNAQPTTSASLPPTPEGSPATPDDAFVLHVPLNVRATCEQGVFSPPDPTVVFNIRCTTTSGIIVTYTQYATDDDMNAAYQDVFARQQIDANSGSCEDHTTWPAESTYDVAGAPAGHRLCTDDVNGTPTITWTDDRLDILSVATGQVADVPGLIDFWTNEAGPVP